MCMRIILYVGFPDADNNLVLRFATCLSMAFWLIPVIIDGPIITLIDHSKFKIFQNNFFKFKDQGLELGPIKLKGFQKRQSPV